MQYTLNQRLLRYLGYQAVEHHGKMHDMKLNTVVGHKTVSQHSNKYLKKRRQKKPMKILTKIV
jgi:hypothetical protein